MRVNMSQKQTKDGFSIIEVLIVILVVVVLAAVGFFFWQKAKKNDTAKQSATTAQSSKQDMNKSGARETKADSTDGGKYLYIKEWGVRYLLPDDLRGQVNYGIASVAGTSAYSASFEVFSLNAIEGNNCNLIKTDEGIGGGTGVQLIRSPGVDDEGGAGQPIYISKDGKYYFYVIRPKGLCTPTTVTEQTELAVDDRLVAAIKELQEP
jgi:prepilin-type N-terminal cleavage/methylation domain-containing protein